MSDQAVTAERIIFHGRVQGVGFRATTHRLSRGRPVTGYVRNLSDGTVEMVVRGDSSAIAAFLAAIDQKFARYIRSTDRTPLETGETYSSFEIR